MSSEQIGPGANGRPSREESATKRITAIVFGAASLVGLGFAAAAQQPQPLQAAPPPAAGQTQQVQLRLTNSRPQPVDVYAVPPGAPGPQPVMTLRPGETSDVSSRPGMVWIFGQNRQQFQTYATRPEPFQSLVVAAPGQQRPPQVAAQYQPPPGQSAPPPAAAPQIAYQPQPPRQQMPAQGQMSPAGQPTLAGQASAPAGGPSFPCRGNLNEAQHTICAHPDLADFDARMADTYSWLWGTLDGAGQNELRNDQIQWTARRDACRTDADCLMSLYLDRVAYLNEYHEPDPGDGNMAASGGVAAFPLAARSWGGIVRQGPGQSYPRVASLREGERITVLSQSGEPPFRGRPWFMIQYPGGTGFHWGGIICPIGVPVEGTYQVCN